MWGGLKSLLSGICSDPARHLNGGQPRAEAKGLKSHPRLRVCFILIKKTDFITFPTINQSSDPNVQMQVQHLVADSGIMMIASVEA